MTHINTLIRCLLVFCLALSLAYAQEDKTSDLKKDYPATLNFNGTEWKIDYADKNDIMLIVEYVTGNESVQKWTKLFTYQQLLHKLPPKITPKQFAENIEAQIKKMNIEARFNYLESSDSEAIFEFQVLKPADQQQDEIQRIILGKDREFYVLHYVEKKTDMGDAARKQWLENLKNFDVPLKK